MIHKAPADMKSGMVLPLVIILLGGAAAGWLIFGWRQPAPVVEEESIRASQEQDLRKAKLEIEGMFCLGCRASVVSSLLALEGVTQADADPKTDSGWVIYDPEKISKEEILSAPIFDVYPARLLFDASFSGSVSQSEGQDIPRNIEKKLNRLAEILQQRGIQMEPFFQSELDQAIEGGNWEKAENLLDSSLRVYRQPFSEDGR